MIQDTSIEIFLKNIYPNLTARQRPVLHYLRSASVALTTAELEKALGIPINRITPRVGELRKLGLVVDAGRRRCKATGNMAHAWAAKYPVLPDPFKKKEEKPTEAKVEPNPQQLL
ncbi:MAG TPA: helix-turn-helix domain-containing protein [Terracidiphilus sp.]|jgi:hypothetical protein